MSYLTEVIRRATDIRRPVRRCPHVGQGFHIYAKLILDKFDMFVCVNCDGKIQLIDEWGRPPLPQPCKE